MEPVINIDPDILGGTPVFPGTRVPIKSLFDHLKSGRSVDYFIEQFPTVTRDQTLRLLDHAHLLVLPEKQQQRKSA